MLKKHGGTSSKPSTYGGRAMENEQVWLCARTCLESNITGKNLVPSKIAFWFVFNGEKKFSIYKRFFQNVPHRTIFPYWFWYKHEKSATCDL